MAQDGLAALGESALTLVAEGIRTQDTNRAAHYRVLQKMASAANLQRFDAPQAARDKLKVLLKAGVAEPDVFSRLEVVDGLAALGDPDVIPLLQNLAETDPYRSEDTQHQYPVREKAARALAHIQAKQQASQQ
jgi:HEAT repeat protein